MTTTVLGERTIGECVPAALSVNASLLADIRAKLAAAVKLQAKLVVTPPSLAANLQAAIKIVESLTIRPQLPGATLDLTAFASVIASLTAALNAALTFNLALGTAGVMALTCEGPIGAMGTELTSTVETLFPPTSEGFALVLIGSTPEVHAAMRIVFGIS